MMSLSSQMRRLVRPMIHASTAQRAFSSLLLQPLPAKDQLPVELVEMELTKAEQARLQEKWDLANNSAKEELKEMN